MHPRRTGLDRANWCSRSLCDLSVGETVEVVQLHHLDIFGAKRGDRGVHHDRGVDCRCRISDADINVEQRHRRPRRFASTDVDRHPRRHRGEPRRDRTRRIESRRGAPGAQHRLLHRIVGKVGTAKPVPSDAMDQPPILAVQPSKRMVVTCFQSRDELRVRQALAANHTTTPHDANLHPAPLAVAHRGVCHRRCRSNPVSVLRSLARRLE